jgi:hypothetical protein
MLLGPKLTFSKLSYLFHCYYQQYYLYYFPNIIEQGVEVAFLKLSMLVLESVLDLAVEAPYLRVWTHHC